MVFHTDTPPGTEDQQPAPSERRLQASRLMSWRSPTARPFPWWKHGTSSHLAYSTNLPSTPFSTYGTSSHLPYSTNLPSTPGSTYGTSSHLAYNTKLPSTPYSTYRTSSHLAYSTKLPYYTPYSTYGTSSHLADNIKSPYSIKTRHESLHWAVEASPSAADQRCYCSVVSVCRNPSAVRMMPRSKPAFLCAGGERDQTRSTGCSASALVWRWVSTYLGLCLHTACQRQLPDPFSSSTCAAFISQLCRV